MAWQKFAVELKGMEAPVHVQTNARDWASVTMDGDAPNLMAMTFQVVHHALLREGVDVPRSYDAFVDDVLDGLPEALDAGDNEALDPTQPDH